MKHALRMSGFVALATAAALVALPAAAGDQDVTGTWTMNVETPQGSGSPTFTLTQEGQDITGTYEGYFGEAPVTGTIEGDEVTLSIEVTAQGQDVKVTTSAPWTGTPCPGRSCSASSGKQRSRAPARRRTSRGQPDV